MYRVWINVRDSDGTQVEANIYRGSDRRHARRVYRGALAVLSPVITAVGWEELS